MAFNLKNIQLGKFDTLPTPEEKMTLLDKKVFEDKFYRIRLVGPFYAMKYHSVQGASKEGKKWYSSVPCLAYNTENGSQNDANTCPYCQAGIPSSTIFYVNAICLDDLDATLMDPAARVESEKSPRDLCGTKFYVKDPNSQSYTPVKVLRLTSSMIAKLQKLAEVNYAKDESGRKIFYDLEDLEHGRDLVISYNAKASEKSNMYSFQFDPDAESRFQPISKEMRKLLLLHDIEAALKNVPTYAQEETKIMRDIERITNATNGGIFLSKKQVNQPARVSISSDDDIDIPVESAPQQQDLDTIDF